MHTDEHILETFIAANRPLPAIAAHLGMTLIALVKWMDANADLLAAAKRALETHIAFLSLHAEAAALIDLTSVSSSTHNEERKRKSASQLLRHTAKRVVAQAFQPVATSSMGSAPHAATPPSPRRGEKHPSDAKGMRGDASAPSTSAAPLPNLVASGVPPVPTSSTDVSAPTSSSSLDASMPSSSSAPSPRSSGEKYPSTEGARGMRGDSIAPSTAESSPNAAPFSDHEIDVLMVTLARHFDIDLTADDPGPEPDSVASSAGPA